LLDDFFKNGPGLWQAPGQGIGGSQAPSRIGALLVETSAVGGIDGAFQCRDRPVEVALPEVDDTEISVRVVQGPGLRDCFGDADRFFAAYERLGELTEFRG